MCKINDDATNWSIQDRFPLFGSYVESNIDNLYAIIQRSAKEYVIFFKMKDDVFDRISYRILHMGASDKYMTNSGADDGQYTSIEITSQSAFAGSLVWPSNRLTYIFINSGFSTQYYLLKELGGLTYSIGFSSIEDFDENWLKKFSGTSIIDFKFEKLNTDFHVPKEKPESQNPIDFYWNIKQNPLNINENLPTFKYEFKGFSGSL